MFPDPDGARQYMSVSEYEELLQRQTDVKFNLARLEMLRHLQRFETFLKNGVVLGDGFPEIRIVTGASAEETSSFDYGIIHLPVALFDRLLEEGKVAAKIGLQLSMPRPFGRYSTAIISLLWAYAHEVTHIRHRHDLAQTQLGDSTETRHVLEWDADATSVACVYQFIRATSIKHSWHAKAATLMHLFFTFRFGVERSESGFGGSSTHPHFADRLLTIPTVLAGIHDGINDHELDLAPSHIDAQRLASLMKRCDMVFLKYYGIDPLTTKLHEYVRSRRAETFRQLTEKLPFPAKAQVSFCMKLPREAVPNDRKFVALGEDGHIRFPSFGFGAMLVDTRK